MGCDIHFYAEKQASDGAWVPAADLHPNPYPEEGRTLMLDEWYTHRNYGLFAILADVRNGYPDDEKIVPISSPRGLPEDVSPEVRKEAESWGVDGHSHSWLTLREILTYDWDQTIVVRSLYRPRGDDRPVDEVRQLLNDYGAEIMRWKNIGDFFSSSTDMRNVHRVEWVQAISHYGENFFPVVTRMARSVDGDVDAVRAVFWFDN